MSLLLRILVIRYNFRMINNLVSFLGFFLLRKIMSRIKDTITIIVLNIFILCRKKFSRYAYNLTKILIMNILSMVRLE